MHAGVAKCVQLISGMELRNRIPEWLLFSALFEHEFAAHSSCTTNCLEFLLHADATN
jgi:hypothetical protein